MADTKSARGMIAVDKMGTKVLFLNPVTYETEVLLEDFPRTMHELLVPTFAGALFTGQISRWTCQWLMVTIQAEWERIWIGDQKVAIARDRFLNGRHVRIKFLCPACTRGCRILHARGRRIRLPGLCRVRLPIKAQRSLGARPRPSAVPAAADRAWSSTASLEQAEDSARITHTRAIADGGKGNAAGHLDLKNSRAPGGDAGSRFDMVQVTEDKRPSSFEMIAAAINRVVEQAPRAQRLVTAFHRSGGRPPSPLARCTAHYRI